MILHADLQELQRAERRVQRWLATLGLQLQGQKTRTSHTFTPFQGEAGFDFLGFNICQVQGEGERKQETTHRLKTIINPSKEAIQRHNAAIEQKLRQGQNASQAQVIQELNPLIMGWTSYYNGLVDTASMGRYDELMEQQLLNWASKRHPGQTRDWLLAQRTYPALRSGAVPGGAAAGQATACLWLHLLHGITETGAGAIHTATTGQNENHYCTGV